MGECSNFIANKCAESSRLLSGLVDVSAIDLQVAVTLLCMCGSFCKIIHLARASLTSDALVYFDLKVADSVSHFLQPLMFLTVHAWGQVQLGLKY